MGIYGLYFNKNPDDREVWLKRSDDENTRKAVRKTFSSAAMIRLVKQVDLKEGEDAERLYERLIDFGAHPNELGMMQAIQQKPGSNGFDHIYLTSDQVVLKSCIKTVAQVGVCSLSIFRNIYKTRFELLDLPNMLNHIKNGC